MDDSIFTKIIKGDIPCHKIYEDEQTFAFLDIHPIQPGHVLVVPKQQIDHLWDLDEQIYQAVMATAKQVANRIRTILQPARVGVQVVGLDVPHAHVHVFPFGTMAEFTHHPDMQAEPDHSALAAMAQKLAF